MLDTVSRSVYRLTDVLPISLGNLIIHHTSDFVDCAAGARPAASPPAIPVLAPPRGGQYLATRWPVSGHVVAKTVATRWLIFGLVNAADATLGGWSRPAGRCARHHEGQPRRHVWGAWRSRSRPLPRSRYSSPSAPPCGRLAAAPARGRPSWPRTRWCTRPPRRSSRRARTLSCDRITT